jgi:serine/threonine protein kinase/tetratricopeptide (TPR) repeat protein
MIDIDRYRRIDEIFQAALELEPRERASYIRRACSGDAALLKEVEDLLASDGEQWELIGTPAFEMVAPLLAKDQPELEAGDSIGHYQVVSLLGVGGMGQVYLAEDAKLRRKVALKLLPPSYTRDESRLRRFQQEARAASALNHPNILTIHELGEVNGEQFIATEFVEGETLRERLNRARLNLSETLDIAVQIAGALAAAHKAGIVHRDIKPENIMLRHDGYVKVLDFGLAKLTEQHEPATQTTATLNVDISSGLVMGTVKYMSPEQARGQQVDPRSDIFSFGVVLYEMIAGRPPFEEKNSNDLISAILKKEPSPLTGVPEEIQRVISRALRKKKEDRYQTIEELLADLKSLKEDKTVANVAAQPRGSGYLTSDVAPISTATSIEYVINKIKRHKNGTALGLVTLVILLAGVGYLGYRYFFRPSSIAVIPFVNESGDESLSDGMTGDLIESLSKVPGLEVKPYSSVVRYKGTNSDALRIGRELNVSAVLFSHLIQTGEDLTLRVELVDSRNGNLRWQRTYQKKKSGLVVLQSELARDLVHELRVPMTDKAQQKLAKHDTENSDAKLLYLKGVMHQRRLTERDINEAIDLFWQAIHLDPRYARAYAAMARARRSLTMCCDGHPTELLKGKEAAEKAVELDPELAEGHSALGSLIYSYDWKWNEAEKEFLRALELDPNNADSHLSYADFLGRMKRPEERNAQGERARELEPYSPYFNAFGANKDPKKAVERIRFAIDLDPNFYFSHSLAAGIYSANKMHDEAIKEAKTSQTLSPDQTWSDVILSTVLLSAGRSEECRAVLDKVLLRSKSRFVPPYHIAVLYNNVGDKERALDWLEKGYEIRDPKMPFLKTDVRIWKNVQDDPHFKDIMRRVGF